MQGGDFSAGNGTGVVVVLTLMGLNSSSQQLAFLI